MKKFEIMILVLLALFSSEIANASAIPENDLRIPIHKDRQADGVSEHDFNLVTSLIHKIYSPSVRSIGGVDLVMNADWNDETVNAYASREVGTWTVHIAGGIARGKGMTKDSLALVVCHEIGHHMGGAPRTFLFEGWPSAEGQADYWATSKCLKKYYQALASEPLVLTNIPAKIIADCNSIYKNIPELKICMRSELAVVHFGNFLNSVLPDEKRPVSIDRFDAREVKGTNTNDYPRPQCRIDTLYQGSLCTISSDVATSETDAKIGHCNDVSLPGTRPRCWYKP